MFEDIFTADDCLEFSPETFIFEGVTFQRDFGPHKKGDKVFLIQIDTPSATCETLREDNTIIHSFKFTLEAK